MPQYSYRLVAFNGYAVPTASMRRVQFVRGQPGPHEGREVRPVEVDVPGVGPRDVRGQPQGSEWEIHVELAATNDADLDELLGVFSEEAGVVECVVEDGNAVRWRARGRVTSVAGQDAPNYFVVTFRVTDPRWEAVAETVTSRVSMSSSPVTFAVTPGGNRRQRPVIRLSADAPKTDILDDYKYAFRGFAVNRSPALWSNLPVELTDVSGHVGTPLNHEVFVGLTGGAVSQRAQTNGGVTAIATSIPYDTGVNGNPPERGIAWLKVQRAQLNEPAGLAAKDATLDYDTGVNGNPPFATPSTPAVILIDNELILYTGGGGLVAGTLTGLVRGYAGTKPAAHADNAAIFLVEQFTYTGGGGSSAGTLTGCVRGVGGTSPQPNASQPVGQAFGDNTPILFSEALCNGDDIRVWWNDVEIERWIDFTNQADTQIWVNVTLPPAVPLTLASNISATNPPSGGTLEILEGVAHLPERGLTAWDDEIIAYNGRDVARRLLLNIERGALGTTPAAHLSGLVDVADLNGALTATATSAAYDGGRNGKLPVSGKALVDAEIFMYRGGGNSASGTLTNLVRGVDGTLPAAHEDNARIRVLRQGFLNPVPFVVSIGKGSAGPAPGGHARRPAFDLSTSSNRQWQYPTPLGVDGAAAYYHDPTTSGHTHSAQFSVSNEVPDGDQNVAGAMRLTDSQSRLAWDTQAPPDAARPPAHRLVLELPQRAGYVRYDAQRRAHVRTRLLVRGLTGEETEIADLQDIAETAVSNQAPAVGGEFDALIVQGVRAAVTGTVNRGVDFPLSSGNHEWYKKLVFDQDTELAAVHFRMRKTAAGSDGTFAVDLLDGSGGDNPSGGKLVLRFDRWRGKPNFSVSNLTTTFAEQEFYPSTYDTANLRTKLPAGTYWVRIYYSVVPTTFALSIDIGTPHTRNGPDYVKTGSGAPTVALNLVAWCRAIHTRGGPVQSDTDLLIEANKSEASVHNVLVGVDAPGMWPYVHRLGDWTNGLYHCVGELRNTTNGDVLRIDKWLDPAAELEIDCERRVVVERHGLVERPVSAAVRPGDPARWLVLNPGVNVLRYTEPNMVNTDLAIIDRARKV